MYKKFPTNTPNYQPIKDDPPFNPNIHLQLETPSYHLTLKDLGYSDEIIAATPTPIAATDCFRILSDEGIAAMYHVCKQLEAFTTSNPRIARNTRGGVYRSAFLRDFSLSEDISQHLSNIMQTPLHPHGMAHQLAHLNYQPLTVGENVDKWHFDTLQVDTVMFVTDPNTVEGGEFQYFKGTRDEMAELKAAEKATPKDRVIVPVMPSAGYAVLMQGNYVVHQAKALRAEGERITLVNGYTYGDPAIADYSALGQLVYADAKQTVLAEYTRHMALRSARHLQKPINNPDFLASADEQVQHLKRARVELDAAIDQLENLQDEGMKHFGD